MPRQPKLDATATEYLRRRQEEAAQAIANYKTAARLLDETRAKRSDTLAQLDKLVDEAEATLKDATKALVDTIGVSGAQAIGAAIPSKLRQGGRPRRPKPQLPPPPMPVHFGGDAA